MPELSRHAPRTPRQAMQRGQAAAADEGGCGEQSPLRAPQGVRSSGDGRMTLLKCSKEMALRLFSSVP